MPECPISLKGEISTNPPRETWYIDPRPFNPSGKCKVKITVTDNRKAGSKEPITGTGDFLGGDIHVSGCDLKNRAIVLEPPPNANATIEWDVTCPECTKLLIRDFRHKQGLSEVLKALFLV